MSQAERERRHQARLSQIDRVSVVAGRSDRAFTDHEATLFERARLLEEELEAHEAVERGLAAFDRLIARVEQPRCAQRADLAVFLRAVWNHQPLPLRLLRGPEPDIAADMIAVLDAYRHGRVELVDQVEGGPLRLARALRLGIASTQPETVRASSPRPA